MSAKTVFISYRRDAVGKLFARLLKDALTHQGYDVFLDVDSISAGHWAEQILTEVPRQSHFLLLLTPGALDRCAESDDWVRREFQQAVESGRNIVPVREESVDLAKMRASCHESVRELFEFQVASIQHGSFESDVDTLIAQYIPPRKAPTALAQTWSPRIDISRIVNLTQKPLVGRTHETSLLSESWDKAVRSEQGRPHVLTFVGLGGEGKTSLVANWAADLAAQSWPGCDGAFAWSFYTQGTRQDAVSSDLFLAEALTFFGEASSAGSRQSAFDKGRRLAQLVGERRALLLLDGLEPLQHGPTSPTPGELKDQGLAALLKGLAATSRGLCVVTTQYAMPDLRAFHGKTAREETLTRLSRSAGVRLLKALGVTGSDLRNLPPKDGDEHSEQVSEFEQLVEDVQGHALTLTLLGGYLCDAHAGDIRKRDLVRLEEADAEERGGHAFRVMDAYTRALESDGDKGQRALALLRLLGLFDRPATAESLEVLWHGEAITGLTESLVGLRDAQRNLTLKRLEDARLLTVNRAAGSGELIALDAHPLVRDYFARRVREQQPEAWRAAHRRLYEHLSTTTQEGDQPTLEGLQPLYQAVSHGCQAGLLQEALDDVYSRRILRGGAHYSWKKLGCFGSDLSAVSNFFESQWDRVSTALRRSDQGFLLNQAGIYLRALGRSTAAAEPMRLGLAVRVRTEDWTNAAIQANNLSELELTLGNVTKAVADAEEAVAYAQRSGDPYWMMGTRTTNAEALHYAGRPTDAWGCFREIEAMSPSERLAFSQRRTSLPRFRYAELLLTETERSVWRIFGGADVQRIASGSNREKLSAVLGRAPHVLGWSPPADGPLLDRALDDLTQGRASFYEAVLLQKAPTAAVANLESALTAFRQAGDLEFIGRCLITRAWLQRASTPCSRPARAESDLDEAWEIAARGPMPLFMADIHLHRARLFFREARYPWTLPQHDLAEARRLIFKHGYLRRRDELEDAEAALRDFKR